MKDEAPKTAPKKKPKAPNPVAKEPLEIPKVEDVEEKPASNPQVLTGESIKRKSGGDDGPLADAVQNAPEDAILCVNNEEDEVTVNRLVDASGKNLLVALRPNQEARILWRVRQR